MWGCFLMSGVKILHFLKDWWKSIPIHQNYTMALTYYIYNLQSLFYRQWIFRKISKTQPNPGFWSVDDGTQYLTLLCTKVYGVARCDLSLSRCNRWHDPECNRKSRHDPECNRKSRNPRKVHSHARYRPSNVRLSVAVDVHPAYTYARTPGQRSHVTLWAKPSCIHCIAIARLKTLDRGWFMHRSNFSKRCRSHFIATNQLFFRITTLLTSQTTENMMDWTP